MSADEDNLVPLAYDALNPHAEIQDSGLAPEGRDAEECVECLADATRVPESKSWLAYVFMPLLLLVPKFSPMEAGPSLLFELELLWVLVQHLVPFVTPINDNMFGFHTNLGLVLWTGQLKFIGISTTVLFVLSWALGYVSRHWWTHIASSMYSLYTLHILTSVIRILTGIVLLGLVTFPLILLWMLPLFRWVWIWLLGMLVPAVCHLIFAIGRAASDSNEPIFDRSQYKSPGPGFDLSTGLTVHLPPSEQRRMQQTNAQVSLAQKSNPVARDNIWYKSKLSIDTEDTGFLEKMRPSWVSKLLHPANHRPFQRSTARNITRSAEFVSEDSHFSRCYCCLDSKPKAIRPQGPAWYDLRYSIWLTKRDRLLRFASDRDGPSASDLGESAVLLEDGSTLNQLCTKCEAICARSNLLDLMSGMSIRRFFTFLRFVFTPGSLTEELFEHWPSTTILLEEAQKGCHLCSLMMDTLSPGQKDGLLQRDSQQAHDSRREDIAVYVKLLISSVSPSAWRKDKNRQYAPSSVMVVPHFGYATVPRRWQVQRSVERAVSLNVDPTMKWWLEHADPIEIRRTSK
jgi:hypothetical protein